MALAVLNAKNITEEVIVEKYATIQNSVSLSKQAIGSKLQDGEKILLSNIAWYILLKISKYKTRSWICI